ncbi:hypothetical protein [Actinacidiphila rubida]|uniref:Uncharacterized protein n=1 Tax=Actinacidiphila rubida TaxID=310780 RepID=A0A1H8S549_9ACTN|nr:hypothetical protein [Actinacidiphila rubida]SEO73755.1 hypothetical protein SAMN05216267_103948 [Actinacidiphila rubida]
MTPRRNPLPHPATWSPLAQRTAIIALATAVLLALAGTAAWITNRPTNTPATAAVTTTPAPTAVPSSAAPSASPASRTGSVAKPPHFTDPLVYAKAAASLLWSYDTRTTSRDQQLAGMRAWMATGTQYANWAAISGQEPDPVLWSRMADNQQYATAAVTESHFPSAFKQALTDDPSALTKAYIYAVTVTGIQNIAWNGGGAGAESRAVTLAIQCRPNADCALVDIAPSVAP